MTFDSLYQLYTEAEFSDTIADTVTEESEC
jgi:hypothetical protein